jgi:hypothetical protein
LGFEVRAGTQDAVLWNRLRTGCFAYEPDHPVEVAPEVWLSSDGWTVSGSFVPPRTLPRPPPPDKGALRRIRSPEEAGWLVWQDLQQLELADLRAAVRRQPPPSFPYCSSFSKFDLQTLDRAHVDIGALATPAWSRSLVADPELPWGKVAPVLAAMLAGNRDPVHISERRPDVERARCQTKAPLPHAALRTVRLGDVSVRGEVPEARENAATMLSALRACAAQHPEARGSFTLAFHRRTYSDRDVPTRTLEGTFPACAEHVFECRHVFHLVDNGAEVTVTVMVD